MQETTEQLSSLAQDCAQAAMWPLSQEQLLHFLDSVHTAQSLLNAALLHAVREIEGRGVPAAQQAANTTQWLRNRLLITSAQATALLHQARLLDTDPGLDTAVSTGQINPSQLAAINATLRELPKDLDAEVLARAHATMADWAPKLDPRQLRSIGKRILDHVAPEVSEAIEEARLQRREKAAHQQRYFTLSPLGDGRVRLRGILDAEAAAIVHAAIDPLCRPDSAAEELAHTGETRTPGQRRADALVDVCRLVLAGGQLPDNGGDRPQVAVTMPFDVMTQQFGPGVFDDTGEPASAQTVRRYACDARLLPIVLGSHSQPLDLGRTRRLINGPLRRALAVRDRGCTFPGCDRPTRWCAAHHLISWADGGPTDLTNLALLCDYHHRTIHTDTGWHIQMGTDGHPEFLPPTWLDPQRRPRRNQFHRRT